MNKFSYYLMTFFTLATMPLLAENNAEPQNSIRLESESSSKAAAVENYPSLQPVLVVSEHRDSDELSHILLSNGLKATYQGASVFHEGGWKIGDQVTLEYVHGKGYFLENDSNGGSLPVKLEAAEKSDAPVIRIREYSGGRLVLDDGREYYIGPWSRGWSRDWQVGDRVVAMWSFHFAYQAADSWIVNMDRTIAKDVKSFAGGERVLSNVRAQLKHPEFDVGEMGDDWVPTVISADVLADHIIFRLSNDMTLNLVVEGDGLVNQEDLNGMIGKKVYVTLPSTLWRPNFVYVEVVGYEPFPAYLDRISSDANLVEITPAGRLYVDTNHAYWLDANPQKVAKNWHSGDPVIFVRGILADEYGVFDLYTGIIFNLRNGEQVRGGIIY